MASIRVGIGGWSFPPWRETFYPKGISAARELAYASRQLGAIEINSTYHGTQKPATFAKWRDETPDDFIFSVKASRFCTQRRVLADGADSVQRFIASGIAELGPKLGPIVWQFPPTKAYVRADFAAFLALLPDQIDGLPLRHALDVRHASFMCADFLQLAREHRCATVFTDADDHPSFADLTGDFVYARLMRTQSRLKNGVAPKVIGQWADRARNWSDGGAPDDLPCVEAASPEPAKPRDVFMFFISGAKEKAPAAAMALLKRLG